MQRPDRRAFPSRLGALPRIAARIVCRAVVAAVAAGIGAVAVAAEPIAPPDWVDDLRPIDDDQWNARRAAHLLERTGFGVLPDEIDRAVLVGPRQAVADRVRPVGADDARLRPFEPSGIREQGIDPFPESRPAATDAARKQGEAIGVRVKPAGNRRAQPVVDQFFFWLRASLLECNRINYWWAERMLLTDRPLAEKMALFWHGHFATHEDKVRDHRKMLQQVRLFQELGLGNFRQLMVAVAQDPAMLAFLDAGVNVRGAPNENFAREILEMFTMGVGRYTEQDIRESARAFTGWNYEGTRFLIHADRHDDGPKRVFGREARYDGVMLIDLILEQPATAEYVASRIYRHFVRDEISAPTARRLGAVLRDNGYELAPLLETIFRSRDFYSEPSVGTRIKPPVELVVSTYRRLGLQHIPGMPDFNDVTRALGQHLLHPPTVAGWAQGRAWITPGLLIERGNFVRDVLFPDFLVPANDRYPQINVGAEVRAVHERISRGLDITAATRPEAAAASGEGMSQSNRMADRDEDFNTRYGSYRGWQRAVEAIRPIPRTMAAPDLSALVTAGGARTTGDAVDLLVSRFFGVPPPPADRAAWRDFLTRELGTDQIERARTYMEDGLRLLLHLMLSSPDYQLG